MTGGKGNSTKKIRRSTDKCLLFFRVLHKVHPWNEECDRAFQELKWALSNPLL